MFLSITYGVSHAPLDAGAIEEKLLPPKEQTFEEAYEVIIGGVKKSLNEFWNNIPNEWKEVTNQEEEN